MSENEQMMEPAGAYAAAQEKIELLAVLFQPEDIAHECELIAGLFEDAGVYLDAQAQAELYRKKAKKVLEDGKQEKLNRAEKIIRKARSASDYDRGIELLQEIKDFPKAKELIEQYRKEKRRYIEKQNVSLGVRILALLAVIAVGLVLVGRWLDQRSVEQKTTTEKTLSDCGVGDKIFFGQYKWKVIDREGDEALLIAVESDKYDDLTDKAFHDKAEAVCWENCTLRSWLNGAFLENGFTEEERAQILKSHLVNEANSEYHTGQGADTDDAVFLFSEQEARAYWDQIHGFELNWLLRTTGNEDKAVMYVSTDHKIRTYGTVVTDELYIRPVIRVLVNE